MEARALDATQFLNQPCLATSASRRARSACWRIFSGSVHARSERGCEALRCQRIAMQRQR
jgi:hypothetical protein